MKVASYIFKQDKRNTENRKNKTCNIAYARGQGQGIAFLEFKIGYKASPQLIINLPKGLSWAPLSVTRKKEELGKNTVSIYPFSRQPVCQVCVFRAEFSGLPPPASNNSSGNLVNPLPPFIVLIHQLHFQQQPALKSWLPNIPSDPVFSVPAGSMENGRWFFMTAVF